MTGGGNDAYGVRFGGRMLPAMMHALMIAETTARMSGGRGAGAEFNRMFSELAAQAGIPDLLRVVDEYGWFKACTALTKAKAFHWHVEQDGRWGSEVGNLSLIVDGRQFRLEHDVRSDDPRVPAIREFLERYAHVEAVRSPDTSRYGPYEPPAPSEGDPSPAPPGP